MTSRQPFRNIKQSPRDGESGTKDKALADNLRVLVKPAMTPRKYVDEVSKEERLTSPFRVLTPRVTRSNTSHYKGETHDERRMQLHESEISIFQQLCLDKHDENAAIEILLDTQESHIPELYTATSNISDQSPRSGRKKSGSVEGKRKFFDRIFKSHRKSPNHSVSPTDVLSFSKESNVSTSYSSNTSDEPSLPTPPSSIPRTRISSIPRTRITVENTFQETSKIDWTSATDNTKVENKVEKARSSLDNVNKIEKARPFTDGENKVDRTISFVDGRNKVDQTRSFLDDEIKAQKTRSSLDDFREGGTTISNISSLSGTHGSSIFTPLNLNRNESLGFESIRDIRKCLIEMERQLGQATNKGQRVSRDKVMRALFTVADSLEDADEKSHLKKELHTSMETKADDIPQPVARDAVKVVRGPTEQESSDEEEEEEDQSELASSDDEEDFTLESGTLFEDDDDTEDSPLNIVSSVGEFFGVDKKGQHAVAEVLDDLLWTEFVADRKTSKKKGKSTRTKSKSRSQKNRRTSARAREDKKSNAKKGRPWWRKRRSKEEEDYDDEEEEEDYDDNDDDEEEDDEYSSSSSEDEFKTYLPTSITVKKKYKKPTKPTELEDTMPRSFSTPHSRVKLVDTESRLGYEMNYKPRRSPVM